MLADIKFTLYDQNAAGEIIKVQYSGAWHIVDNGYPLWSTAISPMKIPITTDDGRFSPWAEYMRKNVECAFLFIERFNPYTQYSGRRSDIESILCIAQLAVKD